MDYFPQTDLRPSTKQLYNRQLQRWLALYPEGTAPCVIYNNPYEAIQRLRRHLQTTDSDKKSVLHRFITTILGYRKYHPSQCSVNWTIYTQWKKALDLSFAEISQYRQQNQPAPSQQEKEGIHMTMKEIEEIRDSLPNSLTRLLIAFYTLIPPVRADYGMVHLCDFGETPLTPNFIYTNDEMSCMKLTDFKTSEKYKEIVQRLPERLHRWLRESLQEHPRAFLFVNRYNQPFTRPHFSAWANEKLSSIFSKTFTLTLFRHIFLSELPKDITVEERQRISQLMGHSIAVQLTYQWNEERD
jgi:hypothetical protein